MSTPYQRHLKDDITRDVSNILWGLVPELVRKLDATEYGGSNLLEKIVEAYAIQFDTLKRSIDMAIEARHTSYVNYLRNHIHAFTGELYSFITNDLGLEITPEMLGSTEYQEDISNVWRNDYEREQWDIILQNIPYFFRHRGTLEGVKSLGRIFGISSAGQGDLPFNPSNPYMNMHRNWWTNYSTAESRFSMPDERFLQDKVASGGGISETDSSGSWSYPKWLKWAGISALDRFNSTYISHMDVAERGYYTNIFLPYQKSTHNQLQWINDVTENLGHFEGTTTEGGQFVPGFYGLVARDSSVSSLYEEIHTNSAMHRHMTSVEAASMYDDDHGAFTIQASFIPRLTMGRAGNWTMVRDANPSYTQYLIDGDPNDYLYHDATNSGTEIAYQKMLHMYPIFTKGTYSTEASDLAYKTDFGTGGLDIGLFLIMPEAQYTFDIFADASNMDNAWDTWDLFFGISGGGYQYTSPSCPDWWEFRDELYYNDAGAGRRATNWNYLDLISIGPEVPMPFDDVGGGGSWKTEMYDQNGLALDPSTPVPDFSTSTPTYSSSQEYWGAKKWTYGNPASSEKMYGGGFVVCATLNDGTEVFARCPYQAIIRSFQTEDTIDYGHPTYDKQNSVTAKTAWHYSDDASDWQWKHRYTSGGATVYPMFYETDEGLTNRGDGEEKHDVGDITKGVGGKQEKLLGTDLSSVYPNSTHDMGRKNYTVVTNDGGSGYNTGDGSNVKTCGLPSPFGLYTANRKITVVLDNTAAGDSPSNAQVRWYLNGIRIWFADYRFSQWSGGSVVSAASDFTSDGIRNTDTSTILGVNHVPHHYSNLSTVDHLGPNKDKQWWFSDGSNQDFWGLTVEASNMFEYVQKHRRFEDLREVVLWKVALDKDNTLDINKKAIIGGPRKGSLYGDPALLNEVSNKLSVYYPFMSDTRTSDQVPKGDASNNMYLYDYSGNGLALYKEASNTVIGGSEADHHVWNTQYKSDAITYAGHLSHSDWGRGGILQGEFDSDWYTRMAETQSAGQFLEGVWRSPSNSDIPEFMADDNGNLKDIFWSHRAIRPVSELKKAALIGANHAKYGRAAKAEWMQRSRHLEPSGYTDDGREVYTVDANGENENLFGSTHYPANRDYYQSLPSNAWWSARKGVGTYDLAMSDQGYLRNLFFQTTKPDPWNYLLKYVNQGLSFPMHNALIGDMGVATGGDMHSGSDSPVVYYPNLILEESHRIATTPVIWTYGGVTKGQYGDLENMLVTSRGWLPRSAKKSWGPYPSNEWMNTHMSQAIDANQFGSPHIHLKKLTEDDMVSGADVVFIPYVDLLTNSAFIRVKSVDFSINDMVIAITHTKANKNNIWVSRDGGATWNYIGEIPSIVNLISNELLDTHVHPIGQFGLDYWTYSLSENSVFNRVDFTSHNAYGKIGFADNEGAGDFTLYEGWGSGYADKHLEELKWAENSTQIRDSKHSLMDVGYGGGMVIMDASNVGSFVQVDERMSDSTDEFIISFGGAGMPYSQDYFYFFWTSDSGNTHRYEMSNGWGDPRTTRSINAHGSRMGGSSFYGSRHMSDEYAQMASNGNTTLYSTPGYGMGIPRNMGIDAPNFIYDDYIANPESVDYDAYVARGVISGSDNQYHDGAYPIFGYFSDAEVSSYYFLDYSSLYGSRFGDTGSVNGPIAVHWESGFTTISGVFTPAIFRGDSGYTQGRFQMVRYRERDDASNWLYSDIDTSSVSGSSIYYNYGLNYPMTLVGMHGSYDESVLKNKGGSADATNVYYLDSKTYDHKDFIPTMLGRDSKVINANQDDAFMNMASFIRFDAGYPSNDGLDRSATGYQGNFSQYPYLWNQWTRPVNLVGGYNSRWAKIKKAMRYLAAGTEYVPIEVIYDPWTFYADNVESGYLAGYGGGWDNVNFKERPAGAWEMMQHSLSAPSPDKLKILDVQDLLQPTIRDSEAWWKSQSALQYALTQSIMSDMGSPRAVMYRIASRTVDSVNASTLGRKVYGLRLIPFAADGTPGWNSNNVDYGLYKDYMEEFDAPTARIFTASAYDSSNRAIYNLGGVPNTFSLGNGGYSAKYDGGQGKTTTFLTDGIGNRFDNNYFSIEECLTYNSFDESGLKDSSSPFWGGYKGMKRVSLSQAVWYDHDGGVSMDNYRSGMAYLSVSNPPDEGADATNLGTAWLPVPGPAGYGHNDEVASWTDDGSPAQRIFGQMVFVALGESETGDPSDVGEWLYYVGGSDNLTNLEIIKFGAMQGVFSSNFYNSKFGKHSDVLTDKDTYVKQPSNAWWLTGTHTAKHNLGYSSSSDFDVNQFLGDPFFQYSTMNAPSNLFPYANSGFIGTSIGLGWKTDDDAGATDYTAAAGTDQYPIDYSDSYGYNLLFKDGDSANVGQSRYHELEGPTNGVFRFQIKDYYGKFRMVWDSSRKSGTDVSNWARIMNNALEPEHGYDGTTHGCIPGYFSPDYTDDAKRALANKDHMHKSGLFDHCTVVANDGTGKKMYVFGGNTNENGHYDIEWTDPSSYYQWKDQPAMTDKGKNIEIWPFGDNDTGWGMRAIAGIGASSSRQMYIMDFQDNSWRLGSYMPAAQQKIGAARVPIIWRSRGPASSIGTLAEPSQSSGTNSYVGFSGNNYLPVNMGVESGILEDKEYFYRGFAYLTGGSSPVRIPCTDVSSGFTSEHSDYDDYGPWEADAFEQPVKWYIASNNIGENHPSFLNYLGYGPAFHAHRLSDNHFDFGKWRWGQDPKDYMTSPMRRIRVFVDTQINYDSGLDAQDNIVNDYFDPNVLTLTSDTTHTYFDTWQKVGWGNDMLLPPNPTQEWAGWKDGTAGYRGMSCCVIPAEDVSNTILKNKEIGDWIIAAGGFSDGIFTPETGNTRWRDLNDDLKTRRDIANEINKNLGTTLNRKIFAYRTAHDSWVTLPIELPTPQIWGNVVWSSNLNSLVFHNGKQDVRTKGGIPRLITQPDDILESNADDMDIDLINDRFYNRGNLGNFAWAGLYKNWREEDRWDNQSDSYGPSNSILSLMFTQPTLSMSWNPLSQIRFKDGERAGAYADYMKSMWDSVRSMVNRKLGISTATGWNEVGGVETDHYYGQEIAYPHLLGTGDMHWWGYPCVHDWRAGQRYRALVAPPPSNYMDESLTNVLSDPSQSLMYQVDSDMHLWPWIMPHKAAMRMPYMMAGYKYIYSRSYNGHSDDSLMNQSSSFTIVQGYDTVNNWSGTLPFMKVYDVLGALREYSESSVTTLNQAYGRFFDYIIPTLMNGPFLSNIATILSPGSLVYPINGEGAGNKWKSDVYSPWHEVWDRSGQLGRSVREFGGVSYDAWIGYMHGGGESYSGGFEANRESSEFWYPRGYDLAPSERTVYGSLGKNLFKTTQGYDLHEGLFDGFPGSRSHTESTITPYSYIRNDKHNSDIENPVMLQNVHTFTDMVNYNAIVSTGYMGAFWSAIEDIVASIPDDPEDADSAQLKRFFGTTNKVDYDSRGILSFSDVWDYNKFSTLNGGLHSVTPSTPRFIFQVSKKIFNEGRMFELHFTDVGRRNLLNNTHHAMHFVGHNGFYVTGVYNEDQDILEWSNGGKDVFDINGDNPKNIKDNLDITSVSFDRNIHDQQEYGVLTFAENEFAALYAIGEQGSGFHYAYYKATGDFDPGDSENWHTVGIENLEYAINDSAVIKSDADKVTAWMCGNSGVIIKSEWDGGFEESQIVNIDPFHILNTGSSVTSENLNSVFFIGRDLARAENEAGVYGWAAGDNGVILRTTDGGETWIRTIVDSSISTCKKVVFYNTEDGFVVTDKGIWKTSNGGKTWAVDKNSLGIAVTESWKDIIALPETYRLHKQSLFPKVIAVSDVVDTEAAKWEDTPGLSRYHHKSTVAVGGAPIKVDVGPGEIKGTPISGEPNTRWPTETGRPGVDGRGTMLSKEGSRGATSDRRLGYTFYPSNNFSLHLYDPSRHLREDV